MAFNFENMGEGINSQWEEYLPSISADGKLFVITRRGPHQNNVVSEDFYQSVFENGQWTTAQNLGPSVNTLGNEGAQCLAPNGKVLFLPLATGKMVLVVVIFTLVLSVTVSGLKREILDLVSTPNTGIATNHFSRWKRIIFC